MTLLERLILYREQVGFYILIEVEEEAVEAVLDKCPEEQAREPGDGEVNLALEALGSEVGAVGDARHPQRRDEPPGRLGQRLEKVAKQRSGIAALVVTRAVDLVEVKVLGEAAVPDLEKERLAEVEELVLLVVGVVVGLLAEVLLARHAGPGMYPGSVLLLFGDALDAVGDDVLFGEDEADEGVVQDFVGGLGVLVRVLVLEDGLNVLAGVVENQAATAGVVI